ncbi:MAG TPA: ATPase domain-containing protein [Thermoplasmata archaeon]|nr:ATPase domain-containing protein [Thermoplasmata archaeon]
MDPAVAPTAAELDQAREDALFQLEIGRSAHYYTVIVFVALLVDGFLVLFFQPSISAATQPPFGSLLFLAFPVLAAAALALFGLRVKWEAYQLWPWERHFWATLASLFFAGFLVFLYFARLFHYGPTGAWPLLPWFYPLALAGVGLPLAALAMTWTDWSPWKTVSVATALLPIILALVLYLPGSAVQGINAIALTLLVSGGLYQTSGSFLHLISSGTKPHEREVISSNQNRLVLIAQDAQAQLEALRFREAALGKREAEVETSEATLRRSSEALEDQRQRVVALADEVDKRENELGQRDRDHEVRTAETNARQVTLDNRSAELDMREQELATRLPRLNVREQKVTDRENALVQREAGSSQRAQEAERRKGELQELEHRLTSRQAEIDRKTGDLLQRESELRSAAFTSGATLPTADAGRLKELEQRESQLARLKMVLDEQNVTLGRKSKDVERVVLESQRAAGEVARREEALTARQSALERQELEFKERSEVGTATRDRLTSALKSVEDRSKDLERREAELRSRTSEIGLQSMSAEKREAAAKSLEAKVAMDRAALEKLERQLREREKAVDTRAAETAVQRAAQGPAEGGPSATISGGFSAPDELLRPALNKLADRIPSGTPRLDELILGGLPPRSHILLVGPPFTGKETVVHAFIAEGLRRGDPCVIVTAAQSPDEVEAKVGVILPQLKEFTQKGKITWIDASNPEPTPGAKGPTVKGPSDHAGILSALVAAANRGGTTASPLRIGFLGLSSCLAHADERAGYVFLQNLVGILKPRNAIAMYSVDKGAIGEAQTQTIQSRVDGSIEFKTDRGKTFLAVQGLGDVQSRDWIEYRATGRGLVIGSFSLERIR